LHPALAAVGRAQPAGDVPPLGAEARVAAVVVREAQRRAGRHRRVLDRRGGRGESRAEREDRGAPPHRSAPSAGRMRLARTSGRSRSMLETRSVMSFASTMRLWWKLTLAIVWSSRASGPG